jgi:subtilase family serine protease
VTIGKLAVCTLSALLVAALPATGAAARAVSPAPGTDFRHACSAAQPPGWAQCLVLVRTGMPSLRGLAQGTTPAGYSPAELRGAYHLALASVAAGRGETVAVVDAYDDPDAAADLATYRAHYGLPACGTGCFSQVNQEGQASPRPAASGSTGWATEESLDIDMVSAICPNCHILLVEADNSSLASLGQAVNAAVALGARFVSNSYSAAEFSGETAADSAYYDHPGVAVTAAAGDSGYGVGYPAASGYVTSVGGTELTRDPAAARGWSETAWNSGSGATGSGCSAYEPKPSWQADAGCSHRTDNDVAADADPDTGAAIYDSYDQGGWLEVGGTSEATPIIAATYALAGPPGVGSDPAGYPYEHSAALGDVTSGSDGSCGGSYLCTARPGYDGPTGWGTPDGTGR